MSNASNAPDIPVLTVSLLAVAALFLLLVGRQTYHLVRSSTDALSYTVDVLVITGICGASALGMVGLGWVFDL